MHDMALYFPYIRPPNDAWFRQMALYWDSIGAIVPFDYKRDPNSAPHFETLIDTGLLEAVRPLEHIQWANDFGRDFLAHLETKAAAEKQNPKWRMLVPHRSLVHAEKLDYLGAEMCRLGVAQRVNYSWYELEGWVAAEFMSYLACVIGRSSTKRLLPITNDAHCAALITGSLPVAGIATPHPTDSIREIYLGEVLPSPGADVPFDEIARFKEQHHEQLTKFRRHLECEIILVANIADAEQRAWVAREKTTAMREQTAELAAEMKGRWHSVIFGTIFPLLSAGAQLGGAQIGDPS